MCVCVCMYGSDGGGGNASKLPFRCDHFSIIIFFLLLSFLLFFIFDSLQLQPIWNCWWQWWRRWHRLRIRLFHFFIFIGSMWHMCVCMDGIWMCIFELATRNFWLEPRWLFLFNFFFALSVLSVSFSTASDNKMMWWFFYFIFFFFFFFFLFYHLFVRFFLLNFFLWSSMMMMVVSSLHMLSFPFLFLLCSKCNSNMLYNIFFASVNTFSFFHHFFSCSQWERHIEHSQWFEHTFRFIFKVIDFAWINQPNIQHDEKL